MLPIVFPEGAAARQPLHQRLALGFTQALNDLRHRQLAGYLGMGNVVVALQLPSVSATREIPHGHHAADGTSEGRCIRELSLYREIVKKDLHFSPRLLPIRRNSSRPCRTDRRTHRAKHRCCRSRPLPDSRPGAEPPTDAENSGWRPESAARRPVLTARRTPLSTWAVRLHEHLHPCACDVGQELPHHGLTGGMEMALRIFHQQDVTLRCG